MYPYSGGRNTLVSASSEQEELNAIDKSIVGMILEAINDEIRDAAQYKKAYSESDDENIQNILRSIYLDENKHKRFFTEIYVSITGKQPVVVESDNIDTETDLDRAFFGELEAVEFYRQIMFLLESQRHKNMLFEIITDEQKHADKLNYIFRFKNM